MAKTLDPTRPFGEIHGCFDGRRYEQDGLVFNKEGGLWGDTPAAKSVSHAKKASPAAAALALGDGPDQLSAQLEG